MAAVSCSSVFQQRDAEKSANRVLRGHRREARSLYIARVGVSDDLDLHAVGIGKRQHLFFKPISRFLDENTRVGQPLAPIFEGARGDAKGSLRNFPGAGVSTGGVRPGKEGEDRAGRSSIVAEIKMVGARVVEINGALDEAEAQNIGVEIQIPLRIGSDGSDVVKTNNGTWHWVACFLDSFGKEKIQAARGWPRRLG